MNIEVSDKVLPRLNEDGEEGPAKSDIHTSLVVLIDESIETQMESKWKRQYLFEI